MASEVTADKQVCPVRNIDVPAPILNLRGFNWGTVDEKFQRASVSEGTPSFQRAAIPAPAAAAAVAAPSTDPLSDQLAKQISLAKKGAWAGNGFNTIFRPRPDNDDTFDLRTIANPNIHDNVLELNLTTEQISFGPKLGGAPKEKGIPNRGLFGMPDLFLEGVPYLQTVQDVTNPKSGLPDAVGDDVIDIHFEPGTWLFTPKHESGPATVVRMAVIPHGTTINAQGPAPTFKPGSIIGGDSGKPDFGQVDTTPFRILPPNAKVGFDSMDATNQKTFRLPQNLEKFVGPTGTTGTQRITTAIIKNPHLILQNAIKGLNILETITFEVATGAPTTSVTGGGTANITFLMGKKVPTVVNGFPDSPIAHAEHMRSKFWIELVEYDVKIVAQNIPTGAKSVVVDAIMPPGSTAPTPRFEVTLPPGGITSDTMLKVQGKQIQSSQTVLLNFATLSWPHVSVATLVPVNPQPWTMK